MDAQEKAQARVRIKRALREIPARVADQREIAWSHQRVGAMDAAHEALHTLWRIYEEHYHLTMALEDLSN